MAGSAIIGKARQDDIASLRRMTDSAYSKYIQRIGRPPAPMTADWGGLLGTHDVWVLRDGGESGRGQEHSSGQAVGAIVLGVDAVAGSIKINNLVVDEAAQGRGYGRLLMAHAEEQARIHGCSALTLYTNAKMYENLAMYPKMGFVETERRNEAGYDRVFYRKELLG